MHRPASLSALLLLLTVSLRAQILVVLSDPEDPALKSAAAGAVQAAPGARAVALKDLAGALPGAQAVVALGQAAALADYPPAVPLVVAMVADPSVKPARGHVRVSTLPDAFFLIGKIRDILPRFGRLGAIVAGGHYDDYVKYLSSVGRISGVKVQASKVEDAAGLLGVLRDLSADSDALWVAPGPLFLDPARFRLIQEFCKANKVALFAPVAVLARAGALAGISPSFTESGRLAGEAAAGLAAGKNVAKLIQAEDCEVQISASAAQALGFSVGKRAGTLVE